jgi:deazaflavin-dependent oxidoreductase (nitroreductase family)
VTARALARFNRAFANPAVRLFAGRVPPFAIVRHRGRTSGRAYATPVVAFRAGDALLVGVLYGRTSDWVLNVLAAPRTEVTRRGLTRNYRQPELVTRDEGLRLLPAVVRVPYRILRVRHFLLLTSTPKAG